MKHECEYSDDVKIDQILCRNDMNVKQVDMNDECLNQKTLNKIELPTGILYDIKSKEKTPFKKNSMFKYINENQKSTLIPNEIIDGYMGEYNYNGQTPLMYSVLINNINFVKILLKFDVGRMDDYNKSALDYANELYIEESKNMNEVEIESLQNIIQILEEYEYNE
jgi:hypothetical protein